MIKPALVVTEASGTWGLNTWKDGFIGLCRKHSSGEWNLVRKATAHEIAIFQGQGKPEPK